MSNARELAELSGSYGTGGFVGMKNRIINGAMMIDQRNAGASVTPTASTYTLDRYKLEISQASKLSVQQNAGSVTPPVGFTNYLGITSTSAYSVGAGDFFLLCQRIEGFNVSDFGWGTANAQTVTLSFKVRSSLTGTFGGVFTNSAQDRSYPFTYTISAANTWTNISVTVAGDTSGTWLTNNGVGVFVYFGLGVGSTYGSGTAGAWGAGNIFAPTGATSVVGTSGATFYITGVQLEKGSTATSFDYRPYGTELALCQRYYQTNAGGGQAFLFQGNTTSGSSYATRVYLPVSMRTTPTCTANIDGAGGFSTGSTTPSNIDVSGFAVVPTATATGTNYYFRGSFTASSEL